MIDATRRGFGLGLTGAMVSAGPVLAAPDRGPAAPYVWKSVPFGAGGFVTGFEYHPAQKGLLYTRTDVGGAYRFDPATRRWLPLLDHLGRAEADLMGVLSLALDPQNPDRLYLAVGEYLGVWAQDGAVLRSDDRGRTWAKTPLKLKLGGNAAGRGTGERLQVDPHRSEILLLGTNQDGLMASTDRGATFARLDGFPGRSVTLVLFDPSSSSQGVATSKIYVGSADDKGGLYVSADGGKTFELERDAPNLIPQRAVLDAEGHLYVTYSDGLAPAGGNDGGVFRRDAKSGRWTNISPMRPGGQNPGFAYCGLDLDRRRPGTLVVSTMNRWSIHDDIYLSRDSGRTWRAVGDKASHDTTRHPWLAAYMRGQDRMGHWIGDVRIDPFDSDAMIYGTGYGLWTTANLGECDRGGTVKFAFEVDNLEETVVLDLASPPAGATVYAAMGDISGAGYDDLTKGPRSGLFLPTTETNRCVDYAELAPRYVIRGADQAKTGGYVSDDGGLSWRAFPTTPRVEKDEKGYHGVGRIAISAGAGALVWAPDKQDAYVSKDWGKSWQPCQGWPRAAGANCAPVADRAVEGVFYVYDRAGSILVSTDLGVSFTPVVKGLPKIDGWQSAQLVATPGRVRDLWLAGPWGLVHGAGLDAPFKMVKDVDEAWLVSLGKAAPGGADHAVYLWGRVKGREGIYRSDDAGGKWTRINDDTQRFGALRAMAADPMDHGVVYIGPHGRGLMVGSAAP